MTGNSDLGGLERSKVGLPRPRIFLVDQWTSFRAISRLKSEEN